MPSFSDDDLLQDVSRETIEKLEKYRDLLKERNKTVNLISRKDVDNLWERHILDSLVGYKLLKKILSSEKKEKISCLDIGSGGGFPGLVISVVDDNIHMTLCESIQKKCRELDYFVKELHLDCAVKNKRVETIDGVFDIVTSRAVARISTLLELSKNKIKKNGFYFFWKGSKAKEEIEEARKTWKFRVDVFSLQDILGEDQDDDHRIWLAIRDVKKI